MGHKMYRNIRFSLFVLLCCLWLRGCCDAQRKEKRPKRPKPSRTALDCPDTCALKRRIGKVEARFQDELASWSTEIQNLQQLQNSSNISKPNPYLGSLANVRSEISDSMDDKLNAAVEILRDNMEEQYDQLKSAMSQVNEQSKVLSIGRQSKTADESSQQEIDLRTTINVLNFTLIALRRQNENLLQQTHEIRHQTSVLRAQNEALTDDNEKLRSLAYEQKALTVDKDRIIDVEDKLSQHQTTIRTLEGQIEWLTSRIEQLSEVVDRAQTEAASAAEKANRATAMARKAISVARRRPETTENDDDQSPSEGLRQPDVPPNDCWDLLQMGYNVTGVYRIRPQRSPEAFEVFCEQSYSDGGWTLVQRRRDGSVNFDRNWNDYSAGFGAPDGEIWLGNQKIYYLTNQDTYTLQVLLLDWEGNRAFAEYEGFRIHSNSDNYAIQFGRYTRGNAGDAMRGAVRDGSRNAYLAHFTTNDVDNDSCQPCMVDRNASMTAFDNCSELHGGGWWYRACTDSNINGKYIQPQDFSACGDACYGMQWRTWRGDPHYSLKASMMLIRRIDRHP